MDELLNNAPCGYISFDDRGIIRRCNNTLALLLQFPADELNGQPLESIFNVAGRIFFQTHFMPLLKLHRKAEEIFLSLKAKDGTLIPVVANAASEDRKDGAIHNCIFIPVYNRRKYEDEILEAKRIAEHALKENTETVAARMQVETHAMELDNRISQLNRINAELLQFNSIINHDMQECIRKILLFSNMVIDTTNKKNLSKVIEAAYRLRTITRSLDLFISLGFMDEPVGKADLKKIANSAREDIIAETGISGFTMTGQVLPVIEGSEYQLYMLFYQVFSNAVKFRKDETTTVHVDFVIYESNLYRHREDKYVFGDVIKISITDNGTGFDMQYQDYVFDLFKKLERDTSGMGIGLAVCKKIVDNHAGEISVSSAEGSGTTVTIILPVKNERIKTER